MKKKNILIDSDLMMNLLENGNSYLNDSKKRSLFLGFDKIFKSVNRAFSLIRKVSMNLQKIETILII